MTAHGRIQALRAGYLFATVYFEPAWLQDASPNFQVSSPDTQKHMPERITEILGGLEETRAGLTICDRSNMGGKEEPWLRAGASSPPPDF